MIENYAYRELNTPHISISFLTTGLIIFTSPKNAFLMHIFTTICRHTWCAHQIYQWWVCGQSQLGGWWRSCFWGQLAPTHPHCLLPPCQQHLPPHLAGTLAHWAWELLFKKHERKNTEVKWSKNFKWSCSNMNSSPESIYQFKLQDSTSAHMMTRW